jgi:hypothetical protein
MFNIGSPKIKQEGKATEERPVIMLPETAKEFSAFLPFCIRGKVQPELTFEDLTA